MKLNIQKFRENVIQLKRESVKTQNKIKANIISVTDHTSVWCPQKGFCTTKDQKELSLCNYWI